MTSCNQPYFHGKGKKKGFFEGWYLKHQNDQQLLALIPSFHLDQQGQPSAMLQIITDSQSGQITYPISKFSVARNKWAVKIGDNLFTEKGCQLHVDHPQWQLKGALAYGPWQRTEENIMGPFAHLPRMQCNHGLLSLGHSLRGKVSCNGVLYDFNGGIGYGEKDWGDSFPKDYFWTQCNWREQGHINCIMAAVAHIPLPVGSFQGCIATVYYQGKEYRLATYHGVKVLHYHSDEITLSQGDYLLQINLLEQNPQRLLAPQQGIQSRIIHESVGSTVRYRFYQDGHCLFEQTSQQAGYEWTQS